MLNIEDKHEEITEENKEAVPSPKAGNKDSFVMKFDEFLSKLTPIYIIALYYLVFVAFGWLLYNLCTHGET